MAGAKVGNLALQRDLSFTRSYFLLLYCSYNLGKGLFVFLTEATAILEAYYLLYLSEATAFVELFYVTATTTLMEAYFVLLDCSYNLCRGLFFHYLLYCSYSLCSLVFVPYCSYSLSGGLFFTTLLQLQPE